MPLRVATVLGMAMGAAGLLAVGGVFYLWVTERGPMFGWGSLMAALLVFSGVQLMLLGVIGEYLGRMFLTINQRPQAVVREVARGGWLATGRENFFPTREFGVEGVGHPAKSGDGNAGGEAGGVQAALKGVD